MSSDSSGASDQGDGGQSYLIAPSSPTAAPSPPEMLAGPQPLLPHQPSMSPIDSSTVLTSTSPALDQPSIVPDDPRRSPLNDTGDPRPANLPSPTVCATTAGMIPAVVTPRSSKCGLYPSLLPLKTRGLSEGTRNYSSHAPPTTQITTAVTPRSPSLSSALSHEGSLAPWSSGWNQPAQVPSVAPSIKTDDVSVVTTLTTRQPDPDGTSTTPAANEPTGVTPLLRSIQGDEGVHGSLPSLALDPRDLTASCNAGKLGPGQGSATSTTLPDAIKWQRTRHRMLLQARLSFTALRDLLALEYCFVKPRSLLTLGRAIVRQGWFELIPWYPDHATPPATTPKSLQSLRSHASSVDFAPSMMESTADRAKSTARVAEPAMPLGATPTLHCAPMPIAPVVPTATVTVGTEDLVLSGSVGPKGLGDPSAPGDRPPSPGPQYVVVALTTDSIVYGYSISSVTAADITTPFPPGICEEALVFPLHHIDLEPFFAGLRMYYHGEPVLAFAVADQHVRDAWLDVFITTKSAYQIADEDQRACETRAMRTWEFPDWAKIASEPEKRSWRYWRSSSVTARPPRPAHPTPTRRPQLSMGSSSGTLGKPLGSTGSARSESTKASLSRAASPKSYNLLTALSSNADRSGQRKTSIGSFRTLWTGSSVAATNVQSSRPISPIPGPSRPSSPPPAMASSSLGLSLGPQALEAPMDPFTLVAAQRTSPRTTSTTAIDPLAALASRWVPDEAATVCMVCQTTAFTLLIRKHHCRACGRVICYRCSVMTSVRMEKAVRLCTDCFRRYRQRPELGGWATTALRQHASASSSRPASPLRLSLDGPTLMTTPHHSIPTSPSPALPGMAGDDRAPAPNVPVSSGPLTVARGVYHDETWRRHRPAPISVASRPTRHRALSLGTMTGQSYLTTTLEASDPPGCRLLPSSLDDASSVSYHHQALLTSQHLPSDTRIVPEVPDHHDPLSAALPARHCGLTSLAFSGFDDSGISYHDDRARSSSPSLMPFDADGTLSRRSRAHSMVPPQYNGQDPLFSRLTLSRGSSPNLARHMQSTGASTTTGTPSSSKANSLLAAHHPHYPMLYRSNLASHPGSKFPLAFLTAASSSPLPPLMTSLHLHANAHQLAGGTSYHNPLLHTPVFGSIESTLTAMSDLPVVATPSTTMTTALTNQRYSSLPHIHGAGNQTEHAAPPRRKVNPFQLGADQLTTASHVATTNAGLAPLDHDQRLGETDSQSDVADALVPSAPLPTLALPSSKNVPNETDECHALSP
ncbi:hypothetical protein H4R35_001679 [Dimargaris xerosporica]|nr:hypothetical protein H4R35_001679 [Dimargaris xerosporica]